MWEEQGISDFYESSSSELAARIVEYDKIVDQDESQAKHFQETFHSFEKMYFKKLQEIVKGEQAATANSKGVDMS